MLDFKASICDSTRVTTIYMELKDIAKMDNQQLVGTSAPFLILLQFSINKAVKNPRSLDKIYPKVDRYPEVGLKKDAIKYFISRTVIVSVINSIKQIINIANNLFLYVALQLNEIRVSNIILPVSVMIGIFTIKYKALMIK